MDVNRQIIEFVRIHKFIYDPTDPHYGEVNRKNEAWKLIANRLDLSVNECKKSWILLRDGYRRVMKKRQALESDPVYRKDKEITKWTYEDDLSFLWPHLKIYPNNVEVNYRQNNNIAVGNSREREKETAQNTQKRLLLKRNRTHDGIARRSCSHETTSNHLIKYILDKTTQRSVVHQFFDCMAATVLTFSPHDRAVAKAKVFQVISQMEIEILEREHNPSQSKSSPAADNMEVLESRQGLHDTLPPETSTAELSESDNKDDDEEEIVMNIKLEPEEFLGMNINQEPNQTKQPNQHINQETLQR